MVQVLCISAHHKIQPFMASMYAHILTVYQGSIFLQWTIITTFHSMACYTLFPKRNAGWIQPFFLLILGHWPWPSVMSILSNGLRSNLQKTPFKNSRRFFHNTKKCNLTLAMSPPWECICNLDPNSTHGTDQIIMAFLLNLAYQVF